LKRSTILVIIFIIITSYLPANKGDKDDPGLYYPMQLNDTWYLKAYKQSNKDKLFDVKAQVTGIEIRDGKEYYYFYAPGVDTRYLMRKDENGVYMKGMKYPFPIFNFSIYVDFTPEIQIMKFPLEAGEKWDVKGKAEALIFKFFKLTRNIESSFECVGYEKITTAAGVIDTCHIKVMVDEGDGKGFYPENYWYGRNIGYTYSETKNHHAELVGYKLFKEKDTTSEVANEKEPPEGLDAYK
jgi:hypothetical protein